MFTHSVIRQQVEEISLWWLDGEKQNIRSDNNKTGLFCFFSIGNRQYSQMNCNCFNCIKSSSLTFMEKQGSHNINHQHKYSFPLARTVNLFVDRQTWIYFSFNNWSNNKWGACVSPFLFTVPLFCLSSENHILEDVNKCVIALQEGDVDTLDRTAGAIRGRAARVVHIINAEMENYEPGVYTERVLESIKLLSETG